MNPPQVINLTCARCHDPACIGGRKCSANQGSQPGKTLTIQDLYARQWREFGKGLRDDRWDQLLKDEVTARLQGKQSALFSRLERCGQRVLVLGTTLLVEGGRAGAIKLLAAVSKALRISGDEIQHYQSEPEWGASPEELQRWSHQAEVLAEGSARRNWER